MKSSVVQRLSRVDYLISKLKSSQDVGAIVVFVGSVRGTREKERVLRLYYEAEVDLANEALMRIAADLREKYGITDAIVEHRVGTVEVGEQTMQAVIASKHREEGFQALVELVNRVKHEVPIWKKEITDKGSYWIENS